MKLVFVSSTFKDMQFERDMLHTRVIPMLDSKLERFGESVRFGDLRWGVNTTDYSEEESSKKVLKVCLDQIDDCKPYMIVFIGERYGWIPSQELIKSAAVMKGIEKLDDDISVTELEIEYGALLNPDFEGRILFYFRELDKEGMTQDERKIYEAESSIHQEKIKILKEKIYKKYPNFVRTYHAKWNKETKKVENLEPLMDLIKIDLEKIFTFDIEKYNSLPWQERSIIASKEYFKEKNKIYKDTKTIETIKKQYNESVSLWRYPNSLCSFEYYVGKQGTGKSTRVAHKFMIHYEESLIEKNENKTIVVPFVYQIDEYTSVLENLYYIMIYYLEKALNIKHKEYDYKNNHYSTPTDEAIDYLVKLIKKVKNKKLHIHFFIDNIKVNDFYTGFKKIEERLIDYKKETFYENIPVFFTFGLNEEVLPPNVPFFDICESYPLCKLYQDEVKDIILNILKFSRKELSNEVINHLLAKEQANDPYYLTLIINRLLMLDSEDFENIRNLGDGMNAINKYMISIVDEVGNTVKDIIKEIVKEVSERIDFDFVCKFLAITVYTDLWLKISEYEEIFKFANWEYSELNVSLLLNNLKYIFEKRDGGAEYKITNQEVLTGIKEFILENNYTYVLDTLFLYLKSLPDTHELKSYSLHFALSTNNGEFIARYYLDNVKINNNPSFEELDMYVNYTDFMKKLVKNKQYNVLLDFIKTLCINNVDINHYYLIAALTSEKLNTEDYTEFVNFTVDLQTWLTNNKQISNNFIDTIFVWLQLIPCMNLVQLESMITFDRALLLYSFCSMSKSKLPKELISEAAIVLLRSAIRRSNIEDNYEVIKYYFEEMLDFEEKTLEKVVFKDYYKYIIKGYIAKLIYSLMINEDYENPDKEKYLTIYQETLDKGCENQIFINTYKVSQETYTIGYFHHAYLYVNFDYDEYLKSVINYLYSNNVSPLLSDIDNCLVTVEFGKEMEEKDIKNMLYRSYKKTMFLNNYYDGYKKNLFLVISMMLEEIDSLEISILDELPTVLEKLFINVIKDNHLSFEEGSDEFISSATMDNLEYLSYIVSQLYLFNRPEKIKIMLNNIINCLNEKLEEPNQYINMVIYTLLYSFTDSTEEEDEMYIEQFEQNYEKLDKEDELYKNFKRLFNACLLYITGSVEFKEFIEYLYNIYSEKQDNERYVNY